VKYRVATLALASVLGACTDLPGDEAAHPNEGLLRDFIDGKFDAAGHPLNAKVVPASAIACAGPLSGDARELRGTCEIALPEHATSGDLTISARVRVRRASASGAIVTVTTRTATDDALASEQLTVSRLRAYDQWFDLPIEHASETPAASVVLEIADGAVVDLEYLEVFPQRVHLVIAPGSGIYSDADRLTFELPKGQPLEVLTADGIDLLDQLDALLAQGKATRTTTEFRTLVSVAVGDLLPDRGDVTELRAHSRGVSARSQLRRTPPPCVYEGDPSGERFLLTGFQPFPADGWHENVSAVAVTSLDPSALRGAQVMRLILPVEYDRAAALVTDAIRRCQPDTVISFGQGGGNNALERMSYNLQDTGELAGGAPDNRGIRRAAALISPNAEPTRATLLPIDAIERALVEAGESVQYSTDPGRYICNNVMFAGIGEMQARGRGRAGFIHLTYTTQFDDDARRQWGELARIAVQATADAD